MPTNDSIAALRVANEGFLVASTIERCPKTMMLRELVMNALEAAGTAPAGRRLVEIGPKVIDGVRKLSIWNTGLGMSAPELHRICDLASSLNKVNALDRNFGMGAKVAALPSNKHSLRYRSARNGVVSEVTMGQRRGVYGRIPYRIAGSPVEAEVDDVTARCRIESAYDLSFDWTEVLLFGNRSDQDTVADPYDGDPRMSAGWIIRYLCQRFFRMPPEISLTVRGETEGQVDRVFVPTATRFGRLSRVESVRTVDGIVIHYGYDSLSPSDGDGIQLTGGASLVYRNEIYVARWQQEWVLDAPLYGMPFGAGYIAVFVELPDNFGVQPDLYRQFLRFRKGDQRQVHLADFAALVRDNIPEWLRELIASHGPPRVDFLGDLTDELRDLLIELGVAPQHRGASKLRGVDEEEKVPSPEAPSPSSPRSPPRQVFERPPEVIALSDEAQIDDLGLQGRVAKYYPGTHQIFVNVTYSAVVHLAAQLEHEFSAAPGGEAAKARVARDLAAWAITRKVSRAVVYSLGKKALGWMGEEVLRVQSPESLSIVADDYTLILPVARARMAAMLGIEVSGVALDERSTASRVSQAKRLLGELADARQAARRALQNPSVYPVPILRRVSGIEAQRRNWPAALDWAQQAINANPLDTESHLHLSQVLQQKGDLDLAEAAVRKALDLSPSSPQRYLRQLSIIAQQRGESAKALALARQSLEADETDIISHCHLIDLLLQQNELDAAEQAIRVGLTLYNDKSTRFMRYYSRLAAKRGQAALALQLAQQSLEADTLDAGAHHNFITLLLQQNNLDAAEEAIVAALALDVCKPAQFLRYQSTLATKRGEEARAVEFARRLLEAEPQDLGAHHHLIGLLTQQNDFAAAEEAIDTALAQHADRPAQFIRHRSVLAAKRSNSVLAVNFAREALESDPTDVSLHYHLINLLLQQNDLSIAERAIEEGLALHGGKPARFIRFYSSLAVKRGEVERAVELARRSLEADPLDPWSHHQLVSLLLRQNDLDAAERAIEAALALHADQSGLFLRHLSMVEVRRKNLPAAVVLAKRSVEAGPSDTGAHHHLIGLLMQQNDLDATEAAIESALALHPTRPAPFLRYLSKVASRRHDPVLAIEFARRALEADRLDAGSYHQLISLLLQQNELDAAEEAIEAGLAQHGDRPALFLRHRSSLAARRRDLALAIDLSRQALAADPSDVGSHHHLIGLLLQHNELEGAEQAIEVGLALHGDKPAPFLRYRSSLAAKRRNPTLATEFVRLSLEADPSDASSRQQLVSLLMQQSDLEAAEEALQKALMLHPDRPGVFLRQLSMIEVRRKNLAAAVALARQSLEADASDPWSHDHLIGLLLQSGDLEAAESAAHTALRLGTQNGPDFNKHVAGIDERRRK